MREDDFIVSMTDTKGRITYGNRVFIEFSGYSEAELIGTQHNIIRHPDMPRAVFQLLWNKIQNREECFRLCEKHVQGRRILLGVYQCDAGLRSGRKYHRLSLGAAQAQVERDSDGQRGVCGDAGS